MSVLDSDSSVIKTPEWLEALENKRKRTHKLAHEIGAGAPCLICKEACKGLNLHFWRKLCIECKCRKEDHEVDEEDDYTQFEILFGAKKVKRTTLKFNAQNKSFDWIPPNVSQDLVVDYLKALPQSKVPISNSEGARYRKQQLEKQLPLHDVDPEACHNLSDKEMKEFQKYLDNLRNSVIGQGKILKYQPPQMLRENYYIQGSVTNLVATSEDYGNMKPQGAEIRGHISVNQVPGQSVFSQFVSSESHPNDGYVTINGETYSKAVSTSADSVRHMRSQLLERNDKSHLGNQIPLANIKGPKPYTSECYGDRNHNQVSISPRRSDKESGVGLRTPSSFLSGKYLYGNKSYNDQVVGRGEDNCNGNEKGFTSGAGHGVYSSKSRGPEDANNETNQLPKGCESTFNPSDGVFCKETLEKFKELNVRSSDVPFVPVQGTSTIPVTNKRKEVGTYQSEEGVPSSEILPDPPATCEQCLELLEADDVVVQTDRGRNSALWHAKCFVCETCKELLVDLMYFFHKGKVFCGRHYAEIVNIPRCHACDELIFVKEYTCAEGESYHVRHFCCFHCDQPLGGKQYIPKDSQPVCLDCYQVKYGKKCQTCSLPISAGEQRVSWKELDFHVSPQCFRCGNCSKSLLGGRFMVKNNETFCSKECVLQFVN